MVHSTIPLLQPLDFSVDLHMPMTLKSDYHMHEMLMS